MKNKCKIKIPKKWYEEITESSVHDDNSSGSTQFTCSFVSMCACTHTPFTPFIIFSVSTAFIMVIMFFGVSVTVHHIYK